MQSNWKQSKPWLQPNVEASTSTSTSSSNNSTGSTSTGFNSSPTKSNSTRRPSRGFPDLDFEKNSNNKLILSILDVTSTNVCLSVFTPSPPIPTAYQLKKLNKKISQGTGLPPVIKPPVLSVQLDRRPWPHVAHTGSLPGKDGNGNDTTLVIYGLDSDRKYEITLSLLVDTEEESHAEVEVEVNEEIVDEVEIVPDSSIQATTLPPSTSGSPIPDSTPSTPGLSSLPVTTTVPPSPTPSTPIISSASATPILQPATPVIPATPEGPPPPYSAAASLPLSAVTTEPIPIPIPIPEIVEVPLVPTPVASPPPPDETSLRALLKKIRTSSKRNETVLNASISALKKSVEKGMKEDQRARTRIVGLEEGIRKAKEAEVEARESDYWECEERIAELDIIEREVKEELERRRLGGKKAVSASSSTSDLIPHHVADLHHLHRDHHEETEDEGGHHEGLADIAKELDALNSLIAKAEKDSRQRAKDTLRALELELGQIEGELTQLDRHEASYRPQMMAGQRSSDSFERYGNYIPPQQQEVVQSSSSSFRWRRNNNSKSSLHNSIASTEQAAPSILSSSTSSAISIVDPRNFGRFFRRSVAANTSKEVPSASSTSARVGSSAATIPEFVPSTTLQGTSGIFHPQSFAEERQSMWSSPPSNSSIPLSNNGDSSRYPSSLGQIGSGVGGNRSRSSSLILSRSRSGSLVTVPEVDILPQQSNLSPMGLIGNALLTKSSKGKGRVRKSQHKKNNSLGNSTSNDAIIEGEVSPSPSASHSTTSLPMTTSTSAQSLPTSEKGKTLKKNAPKEKTIVEKSTTGGGKEGENGGIIAIPPPPPGGWSRFKAMRPGFVIKDE